MMLRQLHEINTFKNRFRDLFSQMPSILFDSHGRVQQMNDAAEKALGISRKELLGKSFYKAGCPILDENGKRIPSEYLPWNQAYAKKSIISDIVTGILSSDGRSHWQQSTSMPMINRKGSNKASIITVFTDITKYKQSQAQYMQYQKMEAIGALASGLAHDFNNILTSILSSTQLLMVDLKNSQFENCEQLKDIESEALRGADFAKQLLVLSQPAAPRGKTQINERMHILRRILRRTLPKTISIELDLCEGEIMAHITQTQLEQAILNLSINARDAMPAGGVLRIKSSLVVFDDVEHLPVAGAKRGTYVRLDIQDTGMGILPDLLPRIFEPFYTSKGDRGGTGLGLPIVFAIVKANKGYITADSIPAKGTTISIYIPARSCKPCHKHKKHNPDVPVVKGYETILVVDDEQIITKSTSRLLQRYGYSTFTAFNGREALDVLSANKDKINLVLLDMEMPEMDGLTCLMKISEMKPNLKVITLSGHISKPQMWDMIYAKSKVFVQKPFDFNNLLKVIRDTLDNNPQKHGQMVPAMSSATPHSALQTSAGTAGSPSQG